MKTRPGFTGTVLGLDLSLTGSAACAIALPWRHKISSVRLMKNAGYPLTKEASLAEQRARLLNIRDAVVSFARETGARRAVVEDYAFSAPGQITKLAELGGIVKIMLWEVLGVSTETVRASQARKLLLQKLPQKDSKLFTRVNVKRIPGVTDKWTDDDVDAFVTANFAVSLAGHPAMSFPGVW